MISPKFSETNKVTIVKGGFRMELEQIVMKALAPYLISIVR